MNISQETDDLLEQVIDEKDKILFIEALGCLEHGFYRAGYIAAWIAIIESIKRKIITLSEIGDKAAIGAVAKIVEEEALQRSIDGLLMKYAKEFSLIEDTQYATLEFFWSNRCLFAHPYENAPTPTELLFILQQSVVLVLGVPIVYKKSFIESYIVNLKDKTHFLPDDPVAIKNHISQILPRIANASKPVLFHTLYAGLGFEINNPDRQKYQRRMQIWLNELLKHVGNRLDQPQWNLEEKAIAFPQTAVYCFLEEEVYQLMPARVLQLLLEFACDDKDGIHYEFARQQFAERIGEGKVVDEHKQRFEGFLSENRFTEVHYYYKDANAYADRLIVEIRSGDFNRQQPAIQVLQNPENEALLKNADNDKLVEIGRQVHQAAVYNSWASQSFIKSDTISRYTGILVGAFEASFINNDQVHLRHDYIAGLLIHISRIGQTHMESVINDLQSKVKVCDIGSVYNLEYINKTLENLLKNNQVTQIFSDKLNPILDILAERQKKYYDSFM